MYHVGISVSQQLFWLQVNGVSNHVVIHGFVMLSEMSTNGSGFELHGRRGGGSPGAPVFSHSSKDMQIK